MTIHWLCKGFDDLTTTELFTLMRARVDVFVVEQNCPYPELDDGDIDAKSKHILGYQNNQLCAYARCINKSGSVAIGRVLVLPHARGQGVAQRLMQHALGVCEQFFSERPVMLSAQTYLLGFYQQLGFVTRGSPYLEDGIEHQDMYLYRR
ncbi:GNAT family N-acetyltransferase [Pseudoalteromonas ruthenica]|uniref:GNAT family N-acetyltransferase n=1 Tax=Pseudoalteromonas ruthenica TaxID=151081 RepID=UPI00311A1B16|tara:strand:- start:58890 stop:59339 length:450 start_codon:yes stop_codon:yes gene_type:complete